MFAFLRFETFVKIEVAATYIILRLKILLSLNIACNQSCLASTTTIHFRLNAKIKIPKGFLDSLPSLSINS